MRGEVPMDNEKRQFRRFAVEEKTIVGRLGSDHTVGIIDMSVGGAAVKADRRFPVGSEHEVRIETQHGALDVQGVVVRSRIYSLWENLQGERQPVYAAAMKFHEGSEDLIADFLTGAILVEGPAGAASSAFGTERTS